MKKILLFFLVGIFMLSLVFATVQLFPKLIGGIAVQQQLPLNVDVSSAQSLALESIGWNNVSYVFKGCQQYQCFINLFSGDQFDFVTFMRNDTSVEPSEEVIAAQVKLRLDMKVLPQQSDITSDYENKYGGSVTLE